MKHAIITLLLSVIGAATFAQGYTKSPSEKGYADFEYFEYNAE